MPQIKMTDARFATVAIATPDGPIRIDVAIQSHRLDAEDPVALGHVMFWANGDEANDSAATRQWFVTMLEGATDAIRNAR